MERCSQLFRPLAFLEKFKPQARHWTSPCCALARSPVMFFAKRAQHSSSICSCSFSSFHQQPCLTTAKPLSHAPWRLHAKQHYTAVRRAGWLCKATRKAQLGTQQEDARGLMADWEQLNDRNALKRLTWLEAIYEILWYIYTYIRICRYCKL